MKTLVLGTILAGLMVAGPGKSNAADEDTPAPPPVAPVENVAPEQPPLPPSPTAPASIEQLKEKVDAINASSGTGTRMQDVVKLHKAGVKTSIIETYVRNSRIPAPTPDDLVYLQEQGVPEEVVKALIEHGQNMKSSGNSATPGPAPTYSSQAPQAGASYNNYVYASPSPSQGASQYPQSQYPQIVTYPDYTTTAYRQNNSSLLIIPYNPYRNYGYYSSPFYSGYYAPPWYYSYGYGCGPYRSYGLYSSRPYYNSYYGSPYSYGYRGHYGGGLHVRRR